MRKVTAFILLYAAVAMLLWAGGVHAQQPAAKPAFTLHAPPITSRPRNVFTVPDRFRRALCCLWSRSSPYRTSQEEGLAPAVAWVDERGQAPLPDLFYTEGRREVLKNIFHQLKLLDDDTLHHCR
jgi:hypothetical protein